MKAALIVVLCFLMVKISFAYNPMLSDTTIWWHTFKTPLNKGGLCANTFVYAFENTTIQGLVYKKLIQSDYLYYSYKDYKNKTSKYTINSPNSYFKNIVIEDSISLLGYVREDLSQQKVYFRQSTTSTSEVILYDFNLQIGDTVPHGILFRENHNASLFLPNTLTISGITTVNWNDGISRKYYFEGVSSILGFLLEGVGGSAGLLNPLENALKININDPPIFAYQKLTGNWNIQKFKQIQKPSECPTYSASFNKSWMWQNDQVEEFEYARKKWFSVYNYFYGDTIIDGLAFNKRRVYKNTFSADCFGESWCNQFIGCDSSNSSSIRNDTINKRILIYDSNAKKELPYFDFNLQIGKPFRNSTFLLDIKGNLTTITSQLATISGKIINKYIFKDNVGYSFSINEYLLSDMKYPYFCPGCFIATFNYFGGEGGLYTREFELLASNKNKPCQKRYLGIIDKNEDMKYYYNSIDKTVNLLNNIFDFKVYNLQGIDISNTVKISTNILQLQENQLVILAFFNQKNLIQTIKILAY